MDYNDDQRAPLIEHIKVHHEIQHQTNIETSLSNAGHDFPNNNSPHKQYDEQIQQLISQVNLKVAEKKKEKEAKSEQVPYSKILLTFADQTDKILIACGYITAIVTGLGLPSFVFLFGDIVDSFGGGSTTNIVNAIRPTAIQLTIIGAIIWVTSYLYFALLVIMSERVGKKTRVAYLKAILSQEISWFDKINITELSARLSKECQAITKALGEKMGTIQLSLAMCLSGLFFAFFRGWLMSCILLVAFPVIFIMTHVITIAMQSGFSQNLKSYGQSAGYAEQALNAIRVVHAFGQERTEMSNYDKYLGRARVTGVRTHLKSSLALAGFFFVMFSYYAYAFYTGSWLVYKQVTNSNSHKIYSAGDIMSCFFGVVFGVFSLGMATPNIKAITEGRVAGKMAYEIIDRKPEILLDDPKAQKVGDLSGKIEFKNVSFRYPTRVESLVLDNFTATFEQGKTTAIVGASGSGKSTIIQLIERFYDPENGEIIVDGRPLKSLHLRELRRKIGYVGQEPVLFNCTIKENLLYGDPNATDEQIIAALKSANAWDFINQKMGEGGINTNVGNAGGQLSGGQKQRIAIARAFIKKPKILLFDEATSALDKKNEKEVQASIDKIRNELGSVTTIVIAHRLSTIRNADNIIVMQKGKIIEEGNHEELLEKYPDGLYAKFVKEQEQSEEQQNNQQNDQFESPENLQEGKQTSINRRSTFKKRNQEMDKVEKEMKEKQDKSDEVKEQEFEQTKKKIEKQNNLKRMIGLSEPKINILVGIFVSILQGSLMPIFGIFLSKMLFVLSYDPFFEIIYPLSQVRTDSDKYCLYMFLVSCAAFFTGFSQKFSFGVIGENVTLKIRKQLYSSILQKNIGWFDQKENSPGVLSASMASDAQTINGVSAEGLAASLEASFAILAGIVIGFIYNWKISLVCLACTPFMVLGGIMNVKFQSGMSSDTDAASKEANLLAGDSIMNYRTVASFGNENQIIKDFDRLLQGPVNIAMKKCHVIGMVFGFSQFVQYAVFAVLYYVGAIFQQSYFDNIDPSVDIFHRFLLKLDYSKDIFTAIFAMMFGAMAAGQAQQFGPDLGKAKTAAAKVFGIMDIPSEINAVEQPNSPNLKRIDPKTFRGEIEFQNVWFRYPTRKNDWILKGLNMKINPNETVALVGESGCGKSTTVQLLMRFYDVNEGRILLDGVDIREYNLHDLRRAMGLVQQEPILFNYTISENILYGNLNAYNSEIQEATKIANASEFIESTQMDQLFDDSADALVKSWNQYQQQLKKQLSEKEYNDIKDLLNEVQKDEVKKGKFIAIEGDIDRRGADKKDVNLPHGFDITCGLKGCKLSGGQKQRVAIARAVIRKPQILILDEATSALDESSQRKVQVALDNIMVDRTSIVIAHRLSTIEKCDRIMVLESGRLVEEGGFNELKNKDGGIFQQLASGMGQQPSHKK